MCDSRHATPNSRSSELDVVSHTYDSLDVGLRQAVGFGRTAGSSLKDPEDAVALYCGDGRLGPYCFCLRILLQLMVGLGTQAVYFGKNGEWSGENRLTLEYISMQSWNRVHL